MIEPEPNKVGVKIFETTHYAISREKTRRRQEEKHTVDFADIIDEAIQKLLGTERKPEPWPTADRIWHQMLSDVLGSLKDHKVPEKHALDAIKAVKSNLRVFYRYIGKDPDAVIDRAKKAS